MNATITTTARKSNRRPFGMGLGERHPVHLAPASLDDLAFWEQQQAMEQERELDRRFAEYLAMERMSSGLDC
jgi:hypothetical protein